MSVFDEHELIRVIEFLQRFGYAQIRFYLKKCSLKNYKVYLYFH